MQGEYMGEQYMKALQGGRYCDGNHSYFVAESFASEKDGTIGVVLVCTRCGEGVVKRFDVGQGAGTIETIKREK